MDEKLEKRGLNMSLEHGSAGLPTPPCNPSTGESFYDGGHETIIFTDIQGSTAFGTYDDGSAVTLTLLPYIPPLGNATTPPRRSRCRSGAVASLQL